MESLQEHLAKPVIFLSHSLVQAQGHSEFFLKNIPSQILRAPDLPVFVTINDDKPHSLCYKDLGLFLKPSATLF